MNSKYTKDREDIYNDSYDETLTETEIDSPEYEDSYDESQYAKPPRKKHIFLKFFGGVVALAASVFAIILIAGWLMSFALPAQTNFLIMGTDLEGTRTDTLMFGSYNKKSGEVSIVSIPRDTYVTVDDDTYKKMRKSYPEPAGKSMKINAVHHFGGEEYGRDMLIEQVENLMGRKIDFYAKINFDMFRYIVDSVGPIEFYVPQDMKYYDPYQDLNIDLKEGLQLLDGEAAEQLVRYRSGYANADLGRIDVQQQFLKAFISQTLSKGKIISNPGVFFNILFKYDYVETNAGLFDAISYAFSLGGIDTEKIITKTLPGKPSYASGQSVYVANKEEIDTLFN